MIPVNPIQPASRMDLETKTMKSLNLSLPRLPSDEIGSDPLASVSGIHPNHRDVEHLARLQFIEDVQILLPDGFVDGEVGLVLRVGGLLQGLEILKHGKLERLMKIKDLFKQL